jgi:diguanylate cyclase (GGDEF)-like protein
MNVPRLLQPSLGRSLLVRTLLTSLLPLLLLAGVVLQIAERAVLDSSESESVALARAVATRLDDRVLQSIHYARLIAEIQPTRDAATSGDAGSARALLLPLKARLKLDLLNLADADGRIVAGAQDNRGEQVVRRELTGMFALSAEQSWLLVGEPDGSLMLRAAAPVRVQGERVGVIEVGVRLDSEFLRPLAASQAVAGRGAPLLALFWDGRPRATTSATVADLVVPSDEEFRASPGRGIIRQQSLNSMSYFAVFSAVESHGPTPGVLAVLLPLAPVEAARQTLLLVILALLGGLTIGVIVLAYKSSARFTMPLLRLAQAAQSVEAGDLGALIPATSPHEMGQLERAFGTMAEALRVREQTLAALVAQLEVRAFSDDLTGLPNRAALHERLQDALGEISRVGGSLTLLLLDLDRFKEVNDTLGHEAGDSVLKQVAVRLRDALRTSDLLVRLGGDEFAVLLHGTDEKGGMLVAAKLIAALEKPIMLLDRPLDVGASIGIAHPMGEDDDAATLLRRADVAMYVAKRSGSGFACYTPEQDDNNPDHLLLLGELRRAISDNELVLYFQPKVSLRTGRLDSVEALVRWLHPRRGLLAPDVFIPLAEQTGLIKPLTEWVLDAALRQARVWLQHGLVIPVAVNVSGQNLHDPALAPTIAMLLERHHGRPADLIVEITETSVLRDPPRATEVLKRLRALGVIVAIDDFGAGQSALGYLKQLPADELKIDRSLIQDLAHSHHDAAIVSAVIDLGHNLGLSVVAEGVEDEATWDRLAALGCDVAQGYYMARPLPAAELDVWLRTSQWGPSGVELTRAA